jgi:UDP-N-acetylmuramate dehydrogenase
MYSLKSCNTFGFDVNCNYFFTVPTEEVLLQTINRVEFKENAKLILGKGSNLLFLGDFKGCVLQPAMQYLYKAEDNADSVLLQVGAGVKWDDFVAHCVEQEYYGAENLSWIPGTVGASAVQNIGAYGVEVKDIIHSVSYIDLTTCNLKTLSNAACQFNYRDSIFKRDLKDKAIITQVTYQLQKHGVLQLQYERLNQALKKYNGVNLPNLRKAIIDIRQNKLPDPSVLGNAGSFFKNPFISDALAQSLSAQYPSLPLYTGNDGIKIPAGWLIEQCGWKGKRKGNVGVYAQQSLVLVHYGHGTGNEILSLAQDIISSVFQRFNINLEMEVEIIG